MRTSCLLWTTCLLWAVATSPAQAQEECLARGRVLDAQTTQPLPAANIRLLGTNRGTITNREGAWPLHPNAFRWYDYELIGQRMLGDIPIYEIPMPPRSVTSSACGSYHNRSKLIGGRNRYRATCPKVSRSSAVVGRGHGPS